MLGGVARGGMAWVQLTGAGAQDCLVTEARGHMRRAVGIPGLERQEAQRMLQVGSGEPGLQELESGKDGAEAYPTDAFKSAGMRGSWPEPGSGEPGASALCPVSVCPVPVPRQRSSRVPEGAPFPTFSHKELKKAVASPLSFKSKRSQMAWPACVFYPVTTVVQSVIGL